MFRWNWMSFHLCQLHSFFLVGTTKKNLFPFLHFLSCDICTSLWDPSSLLWPEQSWLSLPLLIWKILQSFNHTRLALVSLYLCCSGQPKTGHSTPFVVSPVLSRQEGSPPLNCWWWSSQCSPGGCWPSLLQGHVAGSSSYWCLPGPQGSSWQKYFPANQLPVCTGNLKFFLLKCWTLYFSLLKIMSFLSAHLSSLSRSTWETGLASD